MEIGKHGRYTPSYQHPWKRRWYLAYSRIVLPLYLCFVAWMGYTHLAGYTPNAVLWEHAPNLFVINIVFLLCYPLYLAIGLFCISWMVRGNLKWRATNTILLFLLPAVTMLGAVFNSLFLSWYAPQYATPIFPGVALLYLIEFVIFSLPTILALRDDGEKTTSAATLPVPSPMASSNHSDYKVKAAAVQRYLEQEQPDVSSPTVESNINNDTP